MYMDGWTQVTCCINLVYLMIIVGRSCEQLNLLCILSTQYNWFCLFLNKMPNTFSDCLLGGLHCYWWPVTTTSEAFLKQACSVSCSCLISWRGHDASQITLALGTAASYPRACQALGAMLSKGALNPADITVLFKMFTSMDPPPVELVSSSLPWGKIPKLLQSSPSSLSVKKQNWFRYGSVAVSKSMVALSE